MPIRSGQPPGGEPRAPQPQPRALIVTIYGLYAREAGGWLSVAALIRLMAGLGVDEPSVRSSVSRLKQRGLIEPRRRDGAAGYALSDRGRDILAEGDRRIFERPRATAADGWLLATFSVPESQRGRRHMLRSRLAWLGFGTVSAGVWIAPAHLATETAEVLRRYRLDRYVDLFRADYLAFGDPREQVRRWWDLNRLEQLYQAFLHLAAGAGEAAGPAGSRRAANGLAENGPGEGGLAENGLGEGGPGEIGGKDAAAFARYVLVLTAWRRLPFLDPGLPPEYLPADWPGLRAAETFTALSASLSGPAWAHVRAVAGQRGPA